MSFTVDNDLLERVRQLHDLDAEYFHSEQLETYDRVERRHSEI